MNDVTGAIGNVQLDKVAGFINKRKKHIKHIWMNSKKLLDKLPPSIKNYNKSSYYFFWIQLEKRDHLAKFLLENGVYTTFRYWPINRIKYFNLDNVNLPSSNWASDHTLNIPIHQNLSESDLSKIIDLIKEFGIKYC